MSCVCTVGNGSTLHMGKSHSAKSEWTDVVYAEQFHAWPLCLALEHCCGAQSLSQAKSDPVYRFQHL